MSQTVFTIVTPIKDEAALVDLEGVLKEINGDLSGNAHLALSPETFPEVHFASFVVFDRDTGGRILVFENCIDGSMSRYLDRLAHCAGIDHIYRHCKDYPPAPDPVARYEYLDGNVRRPHLYHLGTPYRTASSIREDRRVRTRIDQELPAQTTALLARQVARTPQGVKQDRGWEIAMPWLAGLIAVLAMWLEWKILATINFRDRPWWTVLAVADTVAVAVLFLVALSLWRNALPELRARARHWVIAALATVATLIVWRVWPDLVESFLSGHRALAIVALVGLAVLLVDGIRKAVHRRRSDRIAAIRVAGGGASAVPLWRTMQSLSGTYRRERPGLARRLWNWKWWPVPLAIVVVPVWYLRSAYPAYPELLTASLALFFAAKALWLTALTGWPVRSKTIGRRTKGVTFVLIATGAGAFLVASLLGLEAPWLLLALLVTVGLFALWLLTQPSSATPDKSRPEVAADPKAEARLKDVIAQEDHEVQNHMSLVAEVRPGWRRVVLKVFLLILNHMFYRALLPDLWRGKLFGLPTVHCAQWVMIDEGRFLFLSNYNHSWTSYLDDFGAQLASGIQKIWGQCEGNPGTHEFDDFKAFVRKAMVPYRSLVPRVSRALGSSDLEQREPAGPACPRHSRRRCHPGPEASGCGAEGPPGDPPCSPVMRCPDGPTCRGWCSAATRTSIGRRICCSESPTCPRPWTGCVGSVRT